MLFTNKIAKKNGDANSTYYSFLYSPKDHNLYRLWYALNHLSKLFWFKNFGLVVFSANYLLIFGLKFVELTKT